MSKPIVATTSLAGCFGCHMSLLDIDEKVLDLFKLVELNKSPLNDIKKFNKKCDVGIIEGGCANDENVHVLKDFRKNCNTLIALGSCAITGGLPALRNNIKLKECMEEAYINNITTKDNNKEEIIPCDKDIPKILDRIYPINEVVKIDYYIPGCPPRAKLIWLTLRALITGEEVDIPYEVIKYD
ncbi:NADP oxidoreductase [Candidatus Dojkabacteria bacterium]|nr:NADP oxidoreductase [Candidatus Dojkabacteria bacterium]